MSHPDKFMIFRPDGLLSPEGINQIRMFKRFWPIRVIGFIEIMPGDELVQFPHTLVVSGDTGIKEFIAIPKLDPADGFDPVFFADPYKIDHARGVIDISQRQSVDIPFYSQLHQLVDGQRAVSETVI